MAIVERVKNICLRPKVEWPVIATETTSAGSLITGYVLPLAGVSAVASFIGNSIVGRTIPFVGSYRVPFGAGLGMAVFALVMAIVSVFVVSIIINWLAPKFAGEKNSSQAMKVAVYAYTPAWVAGVLQILPSLGIVVFIAMLYGLYLLYLGLPRLMKCPQEKAVGYTAVVVVCTIVLTIVIGMIGGAIMGVGAMGSNAMRGAFTSSLTPSSPGSGSVQFDKDSLVGKMQALGAKMEESTKKMETAQKSGDPNAQMAAAMDTLGTLMGGGKRVEPIAIDQLKTFVPDKFAGLEKKSSNAEKAGIGGMKVSKAEASYGDGDKRARLEISDTGGISGLMGLAGWMGVQGEKEDDSASEKTEKVGGRLVHQRVSKTGGENEFALVLGDRFVVSARGQGVTVDQLRSALSELDLAKLESMKGAGVTP